MAKINDYRKRGIINNLKNTIMDDMYRTLQNACKQAKRHTISEKRVHLIFKEMGLWRIKPLEEIMEINQKALYGWTVPTKVSRFPKGLSDIADGCIIRKQFYKHEGHLSPESCGIKVYNKYTKEEIDQCIMYGQNFND